MNTPSIQHSAFPDGGFVLHKITFASENGRFSAWFAKDGTVLDAERLFGSKSYPVTKDGQVWRMLRTVGQRYVKAA